MTLQLLELPIGKKISVTIFEALPNPLLIRICEEDELLRIPYRKVAQQNRIDNRKDRSIGAATKGKGDNSHRGESRAFAQLPQCISNVLEQAGHLSFALLLVPGRNRSPDSTLSQQDSCQSSLEVNRIVTKEKTNIGVDASRSFCPSTNR